MLLRFVIEFASKSTDCGTANDIFEKSKCVYYSPVSDRSSINAHGSLNSFAGNLSLLR